MAKKAKPLPRWQISLIKGTPAKMLGYIYAPNEKSALELAAKQYDVPHILTNRLVARRDE